MQNDSTPFVSKENLGRFAEIVARACNRAGVALVTMFIHPGRLSDDYVVVFRLPVFEDGQFSSFNGYMAVSFGQLGGDWDSFSDQFKEDDVYTSIIAEINSRNGGA